MVHQTRAPGQAVARADGKFPDVSVAAGRKGFKTELDGLRERMRSLGFPYDEIAAEIGQRYRVRPREAYRLAWGWTLEQAAERFNDPAARRQNPRSQARDTPVAMIEGMSLSLPYVPGRLVIEISDPAVNAGQVASGPDYPEPVTGQASSGPGLATPRPAGRQGMTAASSAVADHPLRRARRRRGLTPVVLAGMSGLSVPFLSMVENGQRTLSRRDHVNALAAALRVSPAEIAPSVIPGFDEWAPAPPVPASAFPPISDEIAVARHRELAGQLIGYVSHGDTYAAGAWLRRMARDPSASPWLLLDRVTAPDIGLFGKGSRPLGGSEARLVSVGSAGRGRAG